MGLFRKTASSTRYPILRQVQFLAPLSAHECALFAQNLDRRTYAPGEWVFHQGYPQVVLYIVAEGEVEVVLEGEREQAVDTLPPGAFFGETGLFVESTRTAGVRAKEPTTLLAMSQQDFRHFVQLNPRAGAKLLYGLGKRLSELLVRNNEARATQGEDTPA